MEIPEEEIGQTSLLFVWKIKVEGSNYYKKDIFL